MMNDYLVIEGWMTAAGERAGWSTRERGNGSSVYLQWALLVMIWEVSSNHLVSDL